MTRYHLRHSFLHGLLLLLAAGTFAEPPALQATATHAALFKNGYGFVRAAVELPQGTTEFYLADLPDAVFGTVWFEPMADGNALTSVQAVTRPGAPTPITTIESLLRANVGNQVKLITAEASYTGELLPVDEPASAVPAESGRYARAQPSWVLVRTEAGSVAGAPSHLLQGVELLSGSLTETPGAGEPMLHCILAAPSAGGSIPLHYLAYGLTWAPAYEVTLRAESDASVRFRGTILSENVELSGTEVTLIAGHPNLRFSKVSDPASLRVSFDEFFRQIAATAPGGADNVTSTPWYASNAAVMGQYGGAGLGGAGPPAGGEAGGMPGTREFAGSAQEDLFFYQPLTLDLEAGGRATHILATTNTPCKHIYVWNVETPSAPDSYQAMRNAPEETPQAVWHMLELENTGDAPWTTGPVLLLRDGMPVSQDMMPFIAAGESGRIRVTRALDLITEFEAVELKRAMETRLVANRHVEYARITVRGKLSVRNLRDAAIDMEVTQSIEGKLLTSAPEPEATWTAEGLNRVNPQGILKWVFTLPAGETKTITYEHEVYVAL
jgi:hypothetical protein